MLFKNMGNVKAKYDGGPALTFEVLPGELLDVPDGYAKPKLCSNGSRGPSVIELIAPQLLPADQEEYERWMRVPEHNASEIEKPKRGVAVLMTEGVPEGVAEQMVAFEESLSRALPAPVPPEEIPEVIPEVVEAPKTKRGRPPKG